MKAQLWKYDPAGEHGADLLLAQLWAQLERDGDLARLFDPTGATLSQFFETLRGADTYYKFDSAGIWLLAWFEPMLHGALFCGYIRPDYRKRELSKEGIREVLLVACHQYTTLIGLTRQPHVVKFCDAVGFRQCGTVPGLIGGYDAMLLSCNKMTVEASRLYGLADQVHAGA